MKTRIKKINQPVNIMDITIREPSEENKKRGQYFGQGEYGANVPDQLVYNFKLITENELKDLKDLEEGTVYVADNGHSIKYRMISPTQKPVEGEINKDKLSINTTYSINQNDLNKLAITIQNIASKNGHAQSCTLKRMIDHIDLISDMANQIHLNHFFNRSDESGKSTWLIKPEHKNTVTRVLMNEFSLYPSDRPLTIKEFQTLISKIEKLSITKADNLHLVLASLPIIDSNNCLYNIVVYVQCGTPPKINYLAKTTNSFGDPEYDNCINMNLEPYHKNILETKQNSIYSLPNSAELGGISYNNIIEASTIGGARFHVGIDICLEHLKERTKGIFNLQLQIDTKHPNTNLITSNVSHIVTSNSMEPKKEWSMHDGFLAHADPILDYVDKDNSSASSKETISEIQVDEIFMRNYNNMKVEKKEDRILVKNPPFGHSFEMQPRRIHTLDKVNANQQSLINAHHERIEQDIFKHKFRKEVPAKQLSIDDPDWPSIANSGLFNDSSRISSHSMNLLNSNNNNLNKQESGEIDSSMKNELDPAEDENHKLLNQMKRELCIEFKEYKEQLQNEIMIIEKKYLDKYKVEPCHRGQYYIVYPELQLKDNKLDICKLFIKALKKNNTNSLEEISNNVEKNSIARKINFSDFSKGFSSRGHKLLKMMQEKNNLLNLKSGNNKSVAVLRKK